VAFKSIFKTKSLLPKITKVSSSIFGRRSTSNPILTPSGTPVSETLVETNNILQEIQKQLALDFAYRIAKEEEEIKDIRKTTATMKGGKLGGGEKDTKLGGGIGKVFQTVTAPVRGIFSRILGFFGWLAAGFVVNKGLKWLAANPGRVEKVVDLVFKHWKIIAGLVIGGVILTTISNLIGTVVMLRGAFNLLKTIGGLPFRRTSSGTTAGGITAGKIPLWQKNPSSLSRLNESWARHLAGKSNLGDKARLLRRGFIKVPLISSLLNKTKGIRRIGGGRTSGWLASIDGIFNYFDRIGSGQSQQKAIAGSGARTVGTALGWKGGMAAGGWLGAFGGPAAPVTVPLGMIIGGVFGAMGTSMLFENIMDKVSDNIGWGNNQLSQGDIGNHEKLFHDRSNMGGKVNVYNVNDQADLPSFGTPGEDAEVEFPNPSPEDNSNPNIASTQSNLGIYTNGSWSFYI